MEKHSRNSTLSQGDNPGNQCLNRVSSIAGPYLRGLGTLLEIMMVAFGADDTPSRYGQLIQQRMVEATERYKNLFGFSGEGSGIVAAFPLETWTEKNEVHVVFDRAIPNSNPIGSGGLGGCTDCKSRIYLDKVR